MTQVRLALEWFLNPDHVPLLLGQELGWFADAGIELTLVEPKEHFDAFAALEAGEVDVAITEPIHLLQDRAKGEAITGFARFLHTNGGVMYLRGNGVERPRDMAGKRLQYPGAPGPGGPAIVRSMIEADGGAKDAVIHPVNHGFFHTNALVEGVADLATLVFFNFEVIEARHRGLDAGFFALKDWGVPDFCQLILVAREQDVRERAELLARLVQIIRRGVDLVHQDPATARAVYAKRVGGLDDPLGAAIFDATVPCFTHDFTMSGDYYQALWTWLTRSGQVAPDVQVDLGAAWTNGLALP